MKAWLIEELRSKNSMSCTIMAVPVPSRRCCSAWWGEARA